MSRLEKVTKRTNERELEILVLRSNTTRQIASIFLNCGNATLKEIYDILNHSLRTPQFSKSSIRGALYRWRKKAILLTDGTRYFLNPRGGREVFLFALGDKEESVHKEEALVQVTSDSERKEEIVVMRQRDWNEFLDVPAAWEENNRIYCVINMHISDAIWALCEQKPKKKKKGQGDRANKAYHKEKDFTLVAFPTGKFHVLTKKYAGWMEHLIAWLVKGGFGKSDLILVRKAIYASYGEAIGTTEVRIVKPLENVKKFKMEIETERMKASLKVVSSHFDEGEIEVTGTQRIRDEWLINIAGATLANLGNQEDLDELREINAGLKDDMVRLQEMFEGLRESVQKKESTQMMQMMKELSEKIESINTKIQIMEMPKMENKKEPDYYV